MRLLLIGCTGFIGKELVPSLTKEGHEIIIISRKNLNNLKLNIPLEKFKFLKIDLSKKQNWGNESLIDQLKEVDGIINLIGEPIADQKWTDRQKEELKEEKEQLRQSLRQSTPQRQESKTPSTPLASLILRGGIMI